MDFLRLAASFLLSAGLAVHAHAQERLLPANTPIPLVALEEVSSSGLQVGTRVRFSVAEDIINRGVVVIPRGSPATGTITWKTGKAVGGKSGKFDVTFDEVVVDGNRFRLMGKHRQEGRGNTLGAVLGSVIISGRSAVMIPGQVVQALTAETISY
ncbi:MAG: hypothetical protein ACK4MT_04910 [Thermaurantiacus tibetensis]|uniref:hypothetical protein n=1 Tax=Thermaurantiacus tibetensis TaxID=2759035 RepID=UPI0018904BAD|nr:hypothetical protein [Thermaurantiacus tibetensis]